MKRELTPGQRAEVALQSPARRRALCEAGVEIIVGLATADCECYRYGLDETDAKLCWPCRMRQLAHLAKVSAQ